MAGEDMVNERAVHQQIRMTFPPFMRFFSSATMRL
jgi:hypothetical protein